MKHPRNLTMGSRLRDKLISISVSEIPDLLQLGLPADQADRVLAAVMMPLISEGARVAYGGRIQRRNDSATQNFTLTISQLLGEAYRRHEVEPGQRPFVHFLPQSNVPDPAGPALAWHLMQLYPYGEVRLVTGAGVTGSITCIDASEDAPQFCLLLDGLRSVLPSVNALSEALHTQMQWEAGRTEDSLDTMRRVMMLENAGAILVGGKKTSFTGPIPGLCSEALLCLQAHKPLVVLGGFGGCARDIAVELGLLPEAERVPRPPHANEFGYAKGLALVRDSANHLSQIFNAQERARLEELANLDSLPIPSSSLMQLLVRTR